MMNEEIIFIDICLSSLKGMKFPMGGFIGHDKNNNFVIGKVDPFNRKLIWIRIFYEESNKWSEKIYL